MDVIQHGGDPQVGNLATPINSSAFSKAFLNNLPGYRKGLSAQRRGLEIGMAHGFFVYGPFAVLGPLRDSNYASLAGLLAAVGLISILTVALSLYGSVGVSTPTSTLTNPNPPENLGTSEGWSEFASSFLLGGCGGAFFAYFLCGTPFVEPLVRLAGSVWSS